MIVYNYTCVYRKVKCFLYADIPRPSLTTINQARRIRTMLDEFVGNGLRAVPYAQRPHPNGPECLDECGLDGRGTI